MRKFKDDLKESVLSFHYVARRDGTQDFGLGNKYLCSLSQPTPSTVVTFCICYRLLFTTVWKLTDKISEARNNDNLRCFKTS